jgi:hypothetical protein
MATHCQVVKHRQLFAQQLTNVSRKCTANVILLVGVCRTGFLVPNTEHLASIIANRTEQFRVVYNFTRTQNANVVNAYSIALTAKRPG